MAQNTSKLTGKDLALIVSKLQMPLIARDYMDANAVPEDDTKYGLHALMSDLSPENALLCAVTTLQEISGSTTGLTYLQETCHDMIERYATDGEKDLIQFAQDLEQTLELMEICQMSFEIIKPEALVFLTILIPQIQSQIMIVDEVLRLKGMKHEDAPVKKEDNVIVIPFLL